MRICFFCTILRGLIAIMTQNLIFLPLIHGETEPHELALENIRQTTDFILSIPENERTFQNTLGAWAELLTQLSCDFLIRDIKPDWRLHQLLTQVSFITLDDDESDTFQKQLASDFMRCRQKVGHENEGNKKFSELKFVSC